MYYPYDLLTLSVYILERFEVLVMLVAPVIAAIFVFSLILSFLTAKMRGVAR